MRIFASWSGAESREIAELLRWWIPSVLQQAEVYVSAQDIGKGERWLANVGRNLSEVDFGIVVVTKTNINAPWILFEAGALSKSVRALVVPLLCGLDSLEAATSPLTQFQYVRVMEDELKGLVLQINSHSETPMEATRVEKAFAKWWPDFISAYSNIDLPDEKPARKESDNVRLSRIEDVLGELMLELRRLKRSPPPVPTLSRAALERLRRLEPPVLDEATREALERVKLPEAASAWYHGTALFGGGTEDAPPEDPA